MRNTNLGHQNQIAMFLDSSAQASAAPQSAMVSTGDSLSPWMQKYLEHQTTHKPIGLVLTNCLESTVGPTGWNQFEPMSTDTLDHEELSSFSGFGDNVASAAASPEWDELLQTDPGAKEFKKLNAEMGVNTIANGDPAMEVAAAMFGRGIVWEPGEAECVTCDPEVDQYFDWEADIADSFGGDENPPKSTAVVSTSSQETPLLDISVEASLTAYLAPSPKPKTRNMQKKAAPRKESRPRGWLDRLAVAREHNKHSSEILARDRDRKKLDGAVEKASRGRTNARGQIQSKRGAGRQQHSAETCTGNENAVFRNLAGRHETEQEGNCEGAPEDYVQRKDQKLAGKARAMPMKKDLVATHLHSMDQKNTGKLQMMTGKERSTHRVYRLEKRTPSRSCHVCCGHRSAGVMAVCSNVAVGTCRKVVCARCFSSAGLGGGKAFAAACVDPKWTCPHCNNNCPMDATCKKKYKTHQPKQTKSMTDFGTAKSLASISRALPKERKNGLPASIHRSAFIRPPAKEPAVVKASDKEGNACPVRVSVENSQSTKVFPNSTQKANLTTPPLLSQRHPSSYVAPSQHCTAVSNFTENSSPVATSIPLENVPTDQLQLLLTLFRAHGPEALAKLGLLPPSHGLNTGSQQDGPHTVEGPRVEPSMPTKELDLTKSPAQQTQQPSHLKPLTQALPPLSSPLPLSQPPSKPEEAPESSPVTHVDNSCHVCKGALLKRQYLICTSEAMDECLNAICANCVDRHGSRGWAESCSAAASMGWICWHCAGACPQVSACRVQQSRLQ